MKIVIDLQGAQGEGSQNRGIGRYTTQWALEVLKRAVNHDVWLVLNGGFPGSIEEIRMRFKGVLPENKIRVWENPLNVRHLGVGNQKQRRISERMREAFIKSMKPDIVHISSLFEGLGDKIVTSIGDFDKDSRTSVTLYDLIPYIYQDRYLSDKAVSDWYSEKIKYLTRANCWMAISESARQDAIQRLGFSADRVFNISAAADANFKPANLDRDQTLRLFDKFKLTRPFVLYTGGVDFRKNIGRLLEAYSILPIEVRKGHQLVIVCKVSDHERNDFNRSIAQLGLQKEDVVFTGFVDDCDLVNLYSTCKAFVFPSLYEGFGLPALEAMQCGAPVIASNASSLPEVIGREDALFDPEHVSEMSKKLFEVLTIEKFRNDLINHGQKKSLEFSWGSTADKCIAAWEACFPASQFGDKQKSTRGKKLAYVSPMPAQKSGIADFSAELLPELAKFYDIDVVKCNEDEAIITNSGFDFVDFEIFENNSEIYDRIIYQFGNSYFHKNMFKSLKNIPGIVDSHDFYLSGVLNFIQSTEFGSIIFDESIILSHGHSVLKEKYFGIEEFNGKYPCNLNVLQDSNGVIFHSQYALDLVRKWYPNSNPDAYFKINLARKSPDKIVKSDARKFLKLGDNCFVAASFGGIGITKRNMEILDAWIASGLAKDINSSLFFVGDDTSSYAAEMKEKIRRLDIVNVKFTGAVDIEAYRTYLQGVDCAVQLRGNSRGETSASVLDCMAYGLPVILNANGSMAEFPVRSVKMIPDDFRLDELCSALTGLKSNTTDRDELGKNARKYVFDTHDPIDIAEKYHEVIEKIYNDELFTLNRLIKEIRLSGDFEIPEADKIIFAEALANNFPPLFNR